MKRKRKDDGIAQQLQFVVVVAAERRHPAAAVLVAEPYCRAELVCVRPDLHIVADLVMACRHPIFRTVEIRRHAAVRHMPVQLRNQPLEMIDAFNERLLVAMQRDGSSYLSNVKLGGRFALRGCVLNYRTTLRDMAILLDDLRRVAKSLLSRA